jgi:glyoxylase-like metal-dependent hydrolase (beta-lactamase superfamily II)
LGITNCYLLTTKDGILLIDTPWARDSVIAELEDGISHAGFSPSDVRAVLVTHYHEDHAGSAGWFQERYGSKIAMHVLDAECARRRRDASTFIRDMEAWLDEIGAPTEPRLDALAQYRNLVGYSGPPIKVDLPLAGDSILEIGGRRVHALHTPGHTPGSVSYFDERRSMLFSGDHVFERRHSNALKRPYNVDRPIASFWDSSRRLVAMKPALVLPGHNGLIEDLSARMRELEELRRSKEREAVALADGSTAWELARQVHRGRSWAWLSATARLAAVGELLAYLYEALDAGLVVATGSAPIHWTARSVRSSIGSGLIPDRSE